jgi:hypothetical protein
MTWNDFLAYCLAHNVTETDFWIFVALSILGIALIIWSWVSWARIRKKEKIRAEAILLYTIMLTASISPLLLMGLVHLIQFFI